MDEIVIKAKCISSEKLHDRNLVKHEIIINDQKIVIPLLTSDNLKIEDHLYNWVCKSIKIEVDND